MKARFAIPYRTASLVAAILIFLYQDGHAQKSIKLMRAKYEQQISVWHEGHIQLTSGVMAGEIQYNQFDQTLHFRKIGSKLVEKTVLSRSIRSFEFYDSSLRINRKFVNMLGAQDYMTIHEVLKELPTFAILSVESTGAYLSSSSNQNGLPFTRREGMTEDMIYFLNDEGVFYPYLSLTYRYNPKLTQRASVAKILDKNLIADFTKEFYEKIKLYAKENKYSFKKKWDLIKIMSYYDLLTRNSSK